MRTFVRLSYGIDEAAPLYPGTPPLEIRKIKEINKGDACNTFLITLSDHSGTHIDMPRHFLNSGKSVKGSHAPELVYKNPVIIDCPKRAGEIIEPGDLDGISSVKNADALLVRTGFYKYRDSNAGVYCNENPSLSPEAANRLRADLPNVKIFGIDSISISSKARREMGAEAHRILLADNGHGRGPVFILEDLYLPSEMKKLDELLVFPVFDAEIGGSPCTVVGLIDD